MTGIRHLDDPNTAPSQIAKSLARNKSSNSFTQASHVQIKFYWLHSHQLNVQCARPFVYIFFIIMYQFYRPGCKPKPGPFGSSDNDVGSPNGSDAYRPLRGPGRGVFPSNKSCNISSVSFSFKSSCNGQEKIFIRPFFNWQSVYDVGCTLYVHNSRHWWPSWVHSRKRPSIRLQK